jgi:hypothetical protein
MGYDASQAGKTPRFDPLLEPGDFDLSENAVQRAVKGYSEVENIELNIDDCAANRPADLAR